MIRDIHVCWFGPAKMPAIFDNCEKSIQRFMHDHRLIIWNDLPGYSDKFFHDAIKSFRWGMASDYARWYLTYHYGGIYMDVDVELLKPVRWLGNFVGRNTGSGIIDGHFMGFCHPQQDFAKKMLERFKTLSIHDPLWKIATCNKELTEQGLTSNTTDIQYLHDVTVYPAFEMDQVRVHHQE